MDKVIIKNKNGADIVCCCASCEKKMFAKDEYHRKCRAGGKIVTPDFLCSSWSMNPNLDNAGKGGGRIRRKDYLRTVYDKGGVTDDIIREFERRHGSRFYNL